MSYAYLQSTEPTARKPFDGVHMRYRYLVEAVDRQTTLATGTTHSVPIDGGSEGKARR